MPKGVGAMEVDSSEQSFWQRRRKLGKWWRASSEELGGGSEQRKKVVLGIPRLALHGILILGAAAVLALSGRVLFPHQSHAVLPSPEPQPSTTEPPMQEEAEESTKQQPSSIEMRVQTYRPLEPHSWTDEQLIAKALAVPAGNSSTPKIAFLFIARGPLPLAPLWERFFHGHAEKFSVYVHASPTYDVREHPLPDAFRGRHIPSQTVEWGTLDMLNAERRLMANALLDPDNTHMVLLSESCIPLFNFPFVYTYITHSPLSFVTNTKCPYENDTWTKDLLPEVPRKIWRKGDEWKELHRDLVVTVLADRHYFKRFAAHFGCPDCKWPRVRGFVDERYIPTVLHVMKPTYLANRTLTWVDWKRNPNRFHPPTYEKTEVNATLLHQIRRMTTFWPYGDSNFPSSECRLDGQLAPCYLFARKFAPDTLAPLLRLAPMVMEY